MLSHFVRKLRALANPDPEVVPVGGVRWHLTPAGRRLFDEAGPLVETWPAVVVKQNLQRTISRITLPAATLYLKRCRANTPRAWVRELLRPPKARLEFENAVELRHRGVPCTEPLGWAEVDSRWPGDSYILTREQPDAVPLDVYLSRPLPLPERWGVAAKLGLLFAGMHAAGVSHPDPHPGNFLYDSRQLTLLDVHAVRFGPPLSRSQARDNLVLLNRWFRVRAERTDRRRFWRAYTAGSPHPDVDTLAREVEAATERSNLRFWASRTGRYLGTNRQFRRVKAGSVRGHAVRDLPDDLLNRWLADPDAVFRDPAVTLLKDSPSSTVAAVPGEIIYKRFRRKSWFAAAKNLIRRSAALRSWVFGHNLLDRHLPTARPLFVAHRYRFGLPCEGYVAFERVPDAVELPAAVGALAPRELDALAESIGRLVRRMHDRHVAHRDLKAPNILLAGPDRNPVLIDLVGLTVGRRVPDAIRVRDLARLNASFVHSPVVRRSVRLRVLRTYLRSTDRAVWESWWVRVASDTANKVWKNYQSGRPLS